jgi:hypothetical protein
MPVFSFHEIDSLKEAYYGAGNNLCHLDKRFGTILPDIFPEVER